MPFVAWIVYPVSPTHLSLRRICQECSTRRKAKYFRPQYLENWLGSEGTNSLEEKVVSYQCRAHASYLPMNSLQGFSGKRLCGKFACYWLRVKIYLFFYRFYHFNYLFFTNSNYVSKLFVTENFFFETFEFIAKKKVR